MKRNRRMGHYATKSNSPKLPYLCEKNGEHRVFTSNAETPRCPVCKTAKVKRHTIKVETTPAPNAEAPADEE